MKDNEWIKNLTVGSKVYVLDNNYGKNRYKLHTVKKITPKGHVRIDNGDLFKGGTCKTSDWSWNILVEYTEELETELDKQKRIEFLQYSINGLDARNINDIDKLEHIWRLLKE